MSADNISRLSKNNRRRLRKYRELIHGYTETLLQDSLVIAGNVNDLNVGAVFYLNTHPMQSYHVIGDKVVRPYIFLRYLEQHSQIIKVHYRLSMDLHKV